MGSALLERVEAAANRDTYRLYSNAMNENQNSFPSCEPRGWYTGTVERP